MTDRPILFSAPMVRALLAGTKTQTRRLCALPDASGDIIEMVKVATEAKTGRSVYEMKDVAGKHVTIRHSKHFITPHFSPRIAMGDRLYVRETWSHTATGVWQISDVWNARDGSVVYQADGALPGAKYWPSIHMPRAFSRLTLTVTDVRVERLQVISQADARAEGVESIVRPDGTRIGVHVVIDDKVIGGWVQPRFSDVYETLWEHLNGAGSWAANPWVAAYTFTVEHGNIDQLRGTS